MIKEVKQLIAQAQTYKALNLLAKNVIEDTDFSDTLIIFMSRYMNLNNAKIKGLIDHDTFNRDNTTLNDDILSLLKDFDIKYLKSSVSESIETKPQILVICKDDEDEMYMREFCMRMECKGYAFKVKQIHKYESIVDYHLIIFDNHTIKKPDNTLEVVESNHISLMKKFIDNFNLHNRYMIHFGENTNIVWDNRDIIYAGNSKFALFSRIQEMLDFIDKDRLYTKQKKQ